MSNITDRQYQQLLTGIAELHNSSTLAEFPGHILPIIKKLVPSDSSYCVSFQDQTMALMGCDVDFSSCIANFTPEYFQQHPILNYHLQTGDWSAFKCSDFLTEEAYHRCDALYENAYKIFDIEDCFIFAVPDPIQPPNPDAWSLQLMLRDAHDDLRRERMIHSRNSLGNLGWGFNRNARSFTDTDRTLLNVLRQHIFQAYQSLQHYSTIQNQLAQLTELTEFVGLVRLSIEGRIHLLTNRAVRLLEHYFPAEWPDRQTLPESLRQYCQQQIQTLRQPNATTLLPPLERRLNQHRLIVRFTVALPQAEILLTLEEYGVVDLSIDTFRAIGLTKRQSEILFYLTQGKTNKEIAQQLGRDGTTIKKHLDGIYQTLQVNGRIEAVSKAYTRLGMLRFRGSEDG